MSLTSGEVGIPTSKFVPCYSIDGSDPPMLFFESPSVENRVVVCYRVSNLKLYFVFICLFYIRSNKKLIQILNVGNVWNQLCWSRKINRATRTDVKKELDSTGQKRNVKIVYNVGDWADRELYLGIIRIPLYYIRS